MFHYMVILAVCQTDYYLTRFEHNNYKSIKVYHYNEVEFNTKTLDISRHFNSNQVKRQKIVEYNEENKIPQT